MFVKESIGEGTLHLIAGSESSINIDLTEGGLEEGEHVYVPPNGGVQEESFHFNLNFGNNPEDLGEVLASLNSTLALDNYFITQVVEGTKTAYAVANEATIQTFGELTQNEDGTWTIGAKILLDLSYEADI